MKLSTVTITKNEEEHLARALRSVQGLADEIIVVDAGSTDRTVEIARTFNAQVLVNLWQGYGPQKNVGLQAATGDWVLFLDADEEVTAELAMEIRSLLAGSGHAAVGSRHNDAAGSPPTPSYSQLPTAYFVRVITAFLGKPLRRLWGTNPRLLRRTAVAWDNREIHEQVVRTDGSTVRLGDPDVRLLHAPLNHPSHYRTLAAYLVKREHYTTRDAEEMLKTGRDRIGKPIGAPTTSILARQRFLVERALKQFGRLFFKKRGFLDGWQGWLWCWLSAEYEYIAARKYLELKRKIQNAKRKTKPKNENFSF